MKIFWGFVLLVFGISYLGAGLGWWGYNIPNSLWQFWPLILIFWGLELLSRNTSFYIPVMIIAVILSGAFIYLTYYNNANNLNWFGTANNLTEKKSEFSAALPKDTKEAEVNVSTGAVEFQIDGETDMLLDGELISNIAEPKLTESSSGGTSSVNLSTVNTGGNTSWWPGVKNIKNNLSLKLNKTVPLKLNVKSGASKIDFDLTHVILSSLSIDTGASSVKVKLGSGVTDGTKVVVSAGASSVEFKIPEEIGVKITTESGLSSKTFEGYTQKDGAWYSKGYDTAKKKIELDLRVGASSMKVTN